MKLGIKAAALAREEGVIVRGIRDIVALSPRSPSPATRSISSSPPCAAALDRL